MSVAITPRVILRSAATKDPCAPRRIRSLLGGRGVLRALRALRMTLSPLATLLPLLLVGMPLMAARAQTIIDPGMTETQVIAKLGQPLSTRSYKTFTYLFYHNGCEKKCGMNDLVTLDSGRVIDAVFRSPSRRYSGTSSSPRAIPAAEASKGNPDAPLSVPAKTTSNPKKPPYVETGL